jgi:uncharacterized protein YoaH (UPF0181 family)
MPKRGYPKPAAPSRSNRVGHRVPIPEQQAALARMRTLRAEGLSFRAIAERIAAEGVKVSHMGVKNALATTAP